MPEVKPHPVADGVRDHVMGPVIVRLLNRLCLLQAVANIGQELVLVRHVLGHSCDARLA